MNEWAILWTAILAAGSLIGVVLIVRPLTKTVRALEQAVKAQKDTIDAAKSLSELTAATLGPKEIVQDIAAFREMYAQKATDVIDQERRQLERDRKGIEESRTSWAMLAMMIFARWVPPAERESTIKTLAASAPGRDINADVFEAILAWAAVLDGVEADILRKRMGGFRVGLGVDPPPSVTPPGAPPKVPGEP